LKTYDIAPLIVSDESENISDLLVARQAKSPKLPLFSKQSQHGQWLDVSAEDFYIEVCQIAKGLIASGIQPGQAVAIMSRTRYEWALVDFAIWFAGAVSVPIYETSSASQMEWILADSDSVALFVENSDHAERFAEVQANAPMVRQIWRFDDDSLDRLKRIGKEVSADTLEMRRKSAKLGDLATIIYTSGTTGRPKGCELTHRGFVELSKNAALELPQVLIEGHSTLLFLPLAHVFARFISVLCVHSGIKVGQTLKTLAQRWFLSAHISCSQFHEFLKRFTTPLSKKQRLAAKERFSAKRHIPPLLTARHLKLPAAHLWA
jgi:long-chain acyl-CoA synthetase